MKINFKLIKDFFGNLSELQTSNKNNLVAAINEVNEVKYNLITDGPAVKTGRKIDGKDEYIKRFHFSGLYKEAQTYSKALGFTLSNCIITGFEGATRSHSNNWFYFTDSTSAATWGMYFLLDNSNNTLNLGTLSSNMEDAYVNIKYVSKT